MTETLPTGTDVDRPARAAASGLAASVLHALETVRDPELDEPVTSLGFVASCIVSGTGPTSNGGDAATEVVAEVHLRLPTYFCAPNFAWLMVADADEAVRAVPGVDRAVVVLDDHFAADVINAGVAARAGFATSFAGLAAGELDDLRADFVRKAVLAGTDRVCRPLLAAGRSPEELAGLTLGDVPDSPELARLRARRSELGLASGDDAPLLLDPVTGDPVRGEGLVMHLRRARLTGVNQDANSGVCRGMLAGRYGGAAGERATTI